MEIMGEIKMKSNEKGWRLIGPEEANLAYQRIQDLKQQGKDVFLVAYHQDNVNQILGAHNVPNFSGMSLLEKIQLPIDDKARKKKYWDWLCFRNPYEGTSQELIGEIVEFDNWAQSQFSDPTVIAKIMQKYFIRSEGGLVQDSSVAITEVDEFYSTPTGISQEEQLGRLGALIEAAHSDLVDKHLILNKSFYRMNPLDINVACLDQELDENEIRKLGFEVMYLGDNN